MHRQCTLAFSILTLAGLLQAGPLQAAPLRAAPNCDMTAYMKVTAACLTGRADGFQMPLNSALETDGDELTTNWNEGAYESSYKGPQFTPTGPVLDPKKSIMPPYNWGAVGQSCDQGNDGTNHESCVSGVEEKLQDPAVNASYGSGFYWKKHGHNCHDAAEDVGMCLTNATPDMAPGCGFDVKVIVWDSEPDINKAVGNVYHSQVLIKRMREVDGTHDQEQVVCLMESQAADPAGTVDKSCCTADVKIFDGAAIDEIAKDFNGCPALYYTSDVYPHLYDVATFRQQRKTGAMDMPTSYDRNAGAAALQGKPGPLLGGRPSVPRIIGAAYDANGIAVQINAK